MIIKGTTLYPARQSEGLREVLLDPSVVPSMPACHLLNTVLHVVETGGLHPAPSSVVTLAPTVTTGMFLLFPSSSVPSKFSQEAR